MTSVQRLYDYWPLPARPPLVFPNGARVAFWVGCNIEHFQLDRPATSIYANTASNVPDPLNYGWRDYGVRVGVWRMMDLLDRCGIRASALVNSDACLHYPEIVEAGNARGWAWLAHGKTNSRMQQQMARDEEWDFLADVVGTIERQTGHRPRGWLGPSLSETFETPGLLAELGLDYLLDWCNDEQPYPMKVRTGRMIGIPYAIEMNDIIQFIARGVTPEDFASMLIDQFDQLYEDSATTGRVMAVSTHPFLVNQPYRHRHFARAIEHIASRAEVWLPTADEIADWYYAEAYAAAVAALAERTEGRER